MRPYGGLIGANPTTASAGPNSAAGGIWTLRDAERLKRAGTWPISFAGPNQITGMQLWLDASDSSTLFDATTGGSLVAADGAVARWEDKSGNARHATQATSGSRPLRKTGVQGGKDVLRFDGGNDSLASSDFLDLSTGQAITTFVVMKRGVTGSTHCILSKLDDDDGWSFRFLSDNLNANFTQGGSATNQTSSSSVSASAFCVLAFKATAGSLTTSTVLYKNGIALASSSSGAVQALNNTNYNLSIGRLFYQGTGYDFLNGDIAEIIMYDSSLTDTDRAAVESYLTTKWGIT